MLKSVKQKIRLHKLKKDAMRPRVHNATMEDVQRKLEHYSPERQAALAAERTMQVQVL